MPNWTTNILGVTGTPSAIKGFMQHMKTKARSDKSHFDFKNILPMPKELNGITHGSCVIGGVKCNEWRDMGDDGAPQPIVGKELERIKKATGGFVNWYDWCCKNWGTKWNACRVDKPTIEKHGKHITATYRFETAWTPPLFVLLKASEMYPGFCFELYCEYEGDNGWTKWTIRNGKITQESSGTLEHNKEEDDV